MHHWTLGLILSVALTSPGSAQTSRVVPDVQGFAGGYSFSAFPFAWSVQGTRFQQVVAAGSVSKTLVRIDELGFRRDRFMPLPYPAVRTPSLEIRLGVAQTTPTTMSKKFDENRAGSTTSQFQGTVSLPAANPGNTNFVVRVPFATPYFHNVSAGDILMEFVIPATNQAASSWGFDAFAPWTVGSKTTQLGVGGTLSNGNQLFTLGGWTEPVMPGGGLPLTAQGLSSPHSGMSIYSLSRHSTPIDLASVGAPGNHIYVGSEMVQPVSHARNVSGGWDLSTRIALPPLASLAGVKAYGQMALSDPAANALGTVTGPGWEFTIGSLPNTESQSIFARDLSTVNGDYFMRTNLSIGGAPFVELKGEFR